VNHLIYITKADGGKELFEEDKLVESLERVGGSPEVVDAVIEKVGNEIKDGMTTGEIYHHAFELLRTMARPVAMKYSLRRALSELGPEGFPFEKFISQIFKTWGYETLTDQTVLGSCVSHEVDVVAWNADKLIMVEAKFHNEFGLKSDVKVALYVKARFDDIKGTMYDYGGIKRPITEGWLVTNTKFTDQAIKYGECKGLKMIGWNYPQKGNLQQIIEESGLHPLTCLATLSNIHKKLLLKKGIVLCRELKEQPQLMKEVGLDDLKITKVLEEVNQVCGL
jgi:Restriction endonuclease